MKGSASNSDGVSAIIEEFVVGVDAAMVFGQPRCNRTQFFTVHTWYDGTMIGAVCVCVCRARVLIFWCRRYQRSWVIDAVLALMTIEIVSHRRLRLVFGVTGYGDDDWYGQCCSLGSYLCRYGLIFIYTWCPIAWW